MDKYQRETLEEKGNGISSNYVDEHLDKALLINTEYLEPRKIFGSRKLRSDLFPKLVPCYTWEGWTPDIPEVDEYYKFESSSLSKVLMALTTNSKCWISGETGTGKSSLVEQIAARLNWPLIRINFDSEITRSDLVGRDVLKSESGTTVSKFIDGILPQALAGPNIILLDEIDFVRPDIAYVLQSVLDNYGLRINEDGGRMVKIHPNARIIATANTLGQGDTSAKYSGARSQSAALRDRFNIWIDKKYLAPHLEIKLLKDKGLLALSEFDDEFENSLKQYIRAHRRAYNQNTISIPLSPRALQATADLFSQFFENGNSETTSILEALDLTILNKCEDTDRSILTGLVQRFFPTHPKIEPKSKTDIAGPPTPIDDDDIPF